MSTKKIFEYLEKFKKLPSYQFERRIDAFILPYLELHFNKHFKDKFKNNEPDFLFLYPEFPIERNSQLRNTVAELKQEKYSDYVDYVMWSKQLNLIYLVEFKTEINSLTNDQFKTYIEACERGWHSLIYYYFNKAISNSNWRKFVYGLYYIHNIAPGILGLNDPLKFEEFIQKSRGIGINEYLEMLKGSIKFESNPEVKFIFLAPSGSEEILKSFVVLNSNTKNHYEGLITLFDFAESVDDELKQLLQNI